VLYELRRFALDFLFGHKSLSWKRITVAFPIL
jgi:hypothetical protein